MGDGGVVGEGLELPPHLVVQLFLQVKPHIACIDEIHADPVDRSKVAHSVGVPARDVDEVTGLLYADEHLGVLQQRQVFVFGPKHICVEVRGQRLRIEIDQVLPVVESPFLLAAQQIHPEVRVPAVDVQCALRQLRADEQARPCVLVACESRPLEVIAREILRHIKSSVRGLPEDLRAIQGQWPIVQVHMLPGFVRSECPDEVRQRQKLGGLKHPPFFRSVVLALELHSRVACLGEVVKCPRLLRHLQASDDDWSRLKCILFEELADRELRRIPPVNLRFAVLSSRQLSKCILGVQGFEETLEQGEQPEQSLVSEQADLGELLGLGRVRRVERAVGLHRMPHLRVSLDPRPHLGRPPLLEGVADLPPPGQQAQVRMLFLHGFHLREVEVHVGGVGSLEALPKVGHLNKHRVVQVE
mmetsp:Transcript_123339/g.241954  ORF Transcript_123339/g.241954 Transcript_123339/m.241954 type:complete len:415 (-) Transcript_123339:209-1453(-)